MLVALGGFVGSGRRVLARQLAHALGIHYYDVDQKKTRAFTLRSGRAYEAVRQPRTKQLRRHFYEQILHDMTVVSRMYPDVVIDDAFHLEEPRGYFFTEAKGLFDSVLFFWIESSDEVARGRIAQAVQKGLLGSVEEGLQRRERARSNFEEFATPPVTLTCTTIDETLQELIRRIRDGSATSAI